MTSEHLAGPLCGCGSNQRLCECWRELDRRKCCDACEHRELPPDVRPNT